MRTIHLHGYLRERFGGPFRFDVASPREAISALLHQLDGFADAIRDGRFGIIRGDYEHGMELDETELTLRFGRTRELHIVPVVQGGGGRGAGIAKIVLGVGLLAVGIGGAILATGGFMAGLGTVAGFGVTWGSIATAGIAITAAGLSSVLTPRPNLDPGRLDQLEPPDQRPSALFNSGPVNRSAQGAPVPVVYGRMRVGSVVVSSGLVTESI
jgi:predicted phage tail protein